MFEAIREAIWDSTECTIFVADTTFNIQVDETTLSTLKAKGRHDTYIHFHLRLYLCISIFVVSKWEFFYVYVDCLMSSDNFRPPDRTVCT